MSGPVPARVDGAAKTVLLPTDHDTGTNTTADAVTSAA